MDNNTLVYFILAVAIGVVLGLIIGYLLAIKKSVDAENRAASFEATSKGLQDQLKSKDVEISRLNDSVTRQQDKLIIAENAKTEAETKLQEISVDVEDLRGQIDSLKRELDSYQRSQREAERKSTELEERNKAVTAQLAEQKQFLAEANFKLADAFKSLSSDALQNNNSAFLHLAKQQLEAKVNESAAELEKRRAAIDTLVKPLGETLEKFDSKLAEIELKREGAYSKMETLLDAMRSTTESLNTGTSQLVSALKTSHIRGKYGEISLRRVVEAAGLSPYCDFDEQASVTTADGRLRPDMRINIPGHRHLLVDSKVPLSQYMLAFETEDEQERIGHLKSHALAVRDHLKKLSEKSYWQQFSEAPDFVIMYLHVESSYGAALMSDPLLIEDGINKQIVLATPSTLITMLRTIGFMWQQERMAASIYEMRDAGVELYQRTNTMLKHFAKVGAHLTDSVNSYNSAIGSMESRVIPQLEKIKGIGGTLASEELKTPKHIETTTRPIIKALPEGDESEDN